MPAFRSFLSPLAGAMFVALCAPASGLVIQLDYSLDDLESGFFSRNPAAKDAVNAAAADIGARITSTLSAVNTDTFTGTSGSATATIEWDLLITNPATGAEKTLTTFNVAANTVRLFVGMRSLLGNTLGEGGPAGSEPHLNIGGGNATQQANALAAAQASSNAALRRNGGPMLANISDSFPGGSPSFSLDLGSMAGFLSLDNDVDNNGTIDSDATLANYWHYNPSSAVVGGKNDMYSVALHEILHAIGFGTSQAWENLSLGTTTWSGAKAIALTGTGNELVTLDGHIDPDLDSFRFSDGVAQDPVMGPSLTTGTRKSLTTLDGAFLQDIGWQTVPEPGCALLLLGTAVPLLTRRARRAF